MVLHYAEEHISFLLAAYVSNAFFLFRVCARVWKLDRKEQRKGEISPLPSPFLACSLPSPRLPLPLSPSWVGRRPTPSPTRATSQAQRAPSGALPCGHLAPPCVAHAARSPASAHAPSNTVAALACGARVPGRLPQIAPPHQAPMTQQKQHPLPKPRLVSPAHIFFPHVHAELSLALAIRPSFCFVCRGDVTSGFRR